jgi:hypothetical protein
MTLVLIHLYNAVKVCTWVFSSEMESAGPICILLSSSRLEKEEEWKDNVLR